MSSGEPASGSPSSRGASGASPSGSAWRPRPASPAAASGASRNRGIIQVGGDEVQQLEDLFLAKQGQGASGDRTTGSPGMPPAITRANDQVASPRGVGTSPGLRTGNCRSAPAGRWRRRAYRHHQRRQADHCQRPGRRPAKPPGSPAGMVMKVGCRWARRPGRLKSPPGYRIDHQARQHGAMTLASSYLPGGWTLT